MHKLNHSVSFGDCDPAGIVYYPNVYAWFDRTFHDWLRHFGGHAELSRKLGAVGIGVMETSARFRRPMHDGDVLSLTLSIEKWSRKSLQLAYEGRVGSMVAVTGTEVRGLFKRGDNGMVAAELDALREIMDGNEQRR